VAYDKLLPDESSLDAPFWAATAAHELRLQRCDTCEAFRFIPSEICSRCHSESATWTRVSGFGRIFTYTVVYRAPTPAYQRDAPYVIVHVDLTEGPRIIGNLVGCPLDQVCIGMPVEVAFEDLDLDGSGITLYRFRPASTSAVMT
jgi:uncharacterized OB-fold protein